MSDMIEVISGSITYGSSTKSAHAHGQEEVGADENGVVRDALSAFWTAFENSCTVGEDKRHDFQTPEWETIARLLEL